MAEDEKPITLVLTHAEALVLFELLARNEDRGDDFNVALEYQAEQRIMWDIMRLIQRQLVEPFMPNYLDLIDAARREIQDNYNSATGEDLPNDRAWPAM